MSTASRISIEFINDSVTGLEEDVAALQKTVDDLINDGMALDTNNPTGDAFGRLRVSNPETLFDSKQIFDNAPLFWDESLESGAGITSSYNQDTASTTFTSTLNTAGKFTRQTFMRFNYQPGKSHQILITGILSESGGGDGVQAGIGYYDDDNGIYFEDDRGTIYACVRTSTSGSPVDTKVAQASWNVDVMDGTGASGITLDTSKTLIYFIDFEWLGVGRVRVGVVIGGVSYVVHEFLHSNIETDVYMSTPNLPIRYQLITTAASPATTMKCICASVASEGGVTDNGVLRTTSTENAHVNANVTGTTYAVIGLRLKAAALAQTVTLITTSMVSETVDDFQWKILMNPTVVGTFTYVDEVNSGVQTAKGNVGTSVTNGVYISGGYASTDTQQISAELSNALRLGASIAGVRDELVLCVMPLSPNADIHATLTWRELS